MILKNPEHFKMACAAKSVIKKLHKPGSTGSIDCPVCEGRLNFSIASNGHVWARCATQGCLAWME
jgi:hypothetical protein